MYKVTNGMSPEILIDVFMLRDETHYHLRHTAQFLVDLIHSVFNGSETKFWSKNMITNTN